MSYAPLLQRLTELRAAASPGPWIVEEPGGFGTIYGGEGYSIGTFEFSTTGAHEANAALAAPAHEYAAVAEALVAQGQRRTSDGEWHIKGCMGGSSGSCFEDCKLARTALAALAKRMGVEVPDGR